jgi:hypothetical protein
MGLGLPFTYATLKNGAPFSVCSNLEVWFSMLYFVFKIDVSALQNLIAYFLFGSLAGTLLFIPLNKFFYSRRFGSLLIIYYVVFLVLAILIETNVIG